MKATSLLLAVVLGLPVLAGLFACVLLGLQSGAWQTLLDTPGFWRALASSIWTATAASVGALLLAHMALAIAGACGWLQKLRAGILPFVAVPHVAMAIGIALLLAPSGLLLRSLSPWATGMSLPPDWMTVQDPWGLALILGLIAKETPFLILMLLGALQQVPAQRLLLQSRTLGYRPLTGWLLTVAPLLQRQIAVATAAVLVFGVTNVEMAIPLGPGMPPTLAVMLWKWFTSGGLERYPLVFAGSLALLLVTLACVALGIAAMRAAGRTFRRVAASGHRGTREHHVRRLASLLLLWVLGSAALSMLALALRGLSPLWRFPDVLPRHVDGGVFALALPQVAAALAGTAVVGIVSAALTLLLCMVLSETMADDAVARRRFAALLFVPLLVPQISFLVGLQWLLVKLGLDGTFSAVVWIHVMLSAPYVFGVVAGARSALDPRLPLVARTLGCTRSQAWLRVTLPLMARSLLLAMALGFAVSCALYLPTIFAGGGRITTVATEAASAAASGDYRMAAVHAAALSAAPLTALLLATGVGAALFRNRGGVPT